MPVGLGIVAVASARAWGQAIVGPVPSLAALGVRVLLLLLLLPRAHSQALSAGGWQGRISPCVAHVAMREAFQASGHKRRSKTDPDPKP